MCVAISRKQGRERTALLLVPKTKDITGTVFVDLMAAYDTVNHCILLLKVARMITKQNYCQHLRSLISRGVREEEQVAYTKEQTTTGFCFGTKPCSISTEMASLNSQTYTQVHIC